MIENKFPSFWKYTYTKWYFWVAVSIYFIWGSLGTNRLIGEHIGNLLANIFIVSIVFLISYAISKNNFKKLNKI